MLGGGHTSFIGELHRIASYMHDQFEFVGGVFGSDFDSSIDFAKSKGLDLSRVYSSLENFIKEENNLDQDQRMEVVVVVTPNSLHYSMAKSLLKEGFHVICEKPMTMNSKEALELEKLVNQTGKTFALTHTYTGYPMVRQMKNMIAQNVIGRVHKVDAAYYQGWINPVVHDPSKRKTVWRLNPEKTGISSCLGDIGVHAFNMIEYTTGLTVKKVLADTNTLYEDNPLDVDATVLLRLDNGVRGIVRSSQIATGEENALKIAVYGDKGGLKWEQENPNYLYHLTDDQPFHVLKPGHAYNSDFAKESTKIAPGHPEGIFDSMANIYKGAAKSIKGEESPAGSFPSVRDGVRGMQFIEASIKSSREGNVWITF